MYVILSRIVHLAINILNKSAEFYFVAKYPCQSPKLLEFLHHAQHFKCAKLLDERVVYSKDEDCCIYMH